MWRLGQKQPIAVASAARRADPCAKAGLSADQLAAAREMR